MNVTTSTSPRDRLYQAYWQDGLLDLSIGLTVLTIGIAWLLDLITLSVVVPAISVPLWHATRVKLIQPRLGYVKFDKPRRQKLMRAQLLLIALGVLALTVGILTVFSSDATFADPQTDRLQKWIVGLPAVLVAIAGLLSGILFGLTRLITYGGLAAMFALLAVYLQTHPGWPILFAGLVPFVTGIFLLANFLRQFPVLPAQPE